MVSARKGRCFLLTTKTCTIPSWIPSRTSAKASWHIVRALTNPAAQKRLQHCCHCQAQICFLDANLAISLRRHTGWCKEAAGRFCETQRHALILWHLAPKRFYFNNLMILCQQAVFITFTIPWKHFTFCATCSICTCGCISLPRMLKREFSTKQKKQSWMSEPHVCRVQCRHLGLVDRQSSGNCEERQNRHSEKVWAMEHIAHL